MNNQQLNLRAAEFYFPDSRLKQFFGDGPAQMRLKNGSYRWFNPLNDWADAGLLLEEMLESGFDVTFLRNKLGVQCFDGEVNREYPDESYLVAITQSYIAWKESE